MTWACAMLLSSSACSCVFPRHTGSHWRMNTPEWLSVESARIPPMCSGSIPGLSVTCGLRLLLVLSMFWEVFLREPGVFALLESQHSSNCKFEPDSEGPAAGLKAVRLFSLPRRLFVYFYAFWTEALHCNVYRNNREAAQTCIAYFRGSPLAGERNSYKSYILAKHTYSLCRLCPETAFHNSTCTGALPSSCAPHYKLLA